eukprot:evm.model.NODE_9322_length_7269_cov_45.420139.1
MQQADPDLTGEAGASPSIKSASSEHAVSALWGRRGTQGSSRSDITLFSAADAEAKDAKHDDCDNNAAGGSNLSLVEGSSTGRSVDFATPIVDLEADGGGKDGAVQSANGGNNKMGIVMQSQ